MNTGLDSLYAKVAFAGQHIAIHHQPMAGGKSDRYTVTPRIRTGLLGWIRWYGPWRQWCFLPTEGTVWSEDCLADIKGFLHRLNCADNETEKP